MPLRVEEARGQFKGAYHRVRVVKTTRSQKKHEVSFYCKMASFKWNPDKWAWKDATHFTDYTSKIGKNLLDPPLLTLVTLNKWQGSLPDTCRPMWARIWDKRKAGKKTIFIWSMWHQVVAVNISAQCTYGLPFTKETLMDRFWDCIQF